GLLLKLSDQADAGLAFDAINKVVWQADIKYAWFGIHIGFQHFDVALVFLHHLINDAVGIIKIANNTGTANTGFYTCGQESDLEAMLAESAFVSCFGFFVNKTRIIGAGLNAIRTAYAALVINEYDAVLTLESRLYWANRDTRWVFTVVTQTGQVKHGGLIAIVVFYFVLQNCGAELTNWG